MEVLRPQEDQHTLGGESVLAQLEARVLNVFRQLSKEEVAMARCRRKGFDLLDGVVGLMLADDQLEDIGAVELLPDLIEWF